MSRPTPARGHAGRRTSRGAGSYGGAFQAAEEAAWLKDFFAASDGTEILFDVIDLAKLKAMVEAGDVTWDVVSIAPDFGLGADVELLEKIDCAIVPCDELQPDRFQTTGAARSGSR